MSPFEKKISIAKDWIRHVRLCLARFSSVADTLALPPLLCVFILFTPRRGLLRIARFACVAAEILNRDFLFHAFRSLNHLDINTLLFGNDNLTDEDYKFIFIEVQKYIKRLTGRLV